MDTPTEIERTARAGADSVYAYVERTAEAAPAVDGYRWQTLTYENEPQYDASAGSGAAGIALFLSVEVTVSLRHVSHKVQAALLRHAD